MGFNAHCLSSTLLISDYKAAANRTPGVTLGILHSSFGFSGYLKVHMAIKTFLKEEKEANNFCEEEARKDFISF